MKTYHNYQIDCKEAEKKLKAAENQRTKIQQNIPKEKLERSKKYKVIEKEVLKVKSQRQKPFEFKIHMSFNFRGKINIEMHG
jgi:transposase